MRKKKNLEEACVLCEHGQEIFDGEFYTIAKDIKVF